MSFYNASVLLHKTDSAADSLLQANKLRQVVVPSNLGTHIDQPNAQKPIYSAQRLLGADHGKTQDGARQVQPAGKQVIEGCTPLHEQH